MPHAAFSGRPRRALAFALLATTAAAALLGGCTKTGLPLPRFSGEQKLASTDAVGAVAQYSAAYAKNPNDPNLAIGYAQTLKTIGSRDRALEVLTAGYRANPENGPLAAELGRLAVDMGRLEIASHALKVAEATGVKDWKTLSAQGTLHAKKKNHAEAQQYFLAALKEKPDAVSVTNNLALSYALDGKPDKSEQVLRKAIASGQDDKRMRQNLALVLGLQGKFDEARNVASKDMTEEQAQANLAYLRNMVSSQAQVAATKPADEGDGEGEGEDWMPFAAANPEAPSKTATAMPAASPEVQIVKAAERTAAPAATVPAASASKTATAATAASPEVQIVKTAETAPPAATVPAAAAPVASTAALAKPRKVAGTPTLVTPPAITTQAKMPVAKTTQAKTPEAKATQATTAQAKTTQAKTIPENPDQKSGEQTGSF
jgi:Flp pilus assembly protein TadD